MFIYHLEFRADLYSVYHWNLSIGCDSGDTRLYAGRNPFVVSRLVSIKKLSSLRLDWINYGARKWIFTPCFTLVVVWENVGK